MKSINDEETFMASDDASNDSSSNIGGRLQSTITCEKVSAGVNGH